MKINTAPLKSWKWWSVTLYIILLAPVIIPSIAFRLLSDILINVGALLYTFVDDYYDPFLQRIFKVHKCVTWANK